MQLKVVVLDLQVANQQLGILDSWKDSMRQQRRIWRTL